MKAKQYDKYSVWKRGACVNCDKPFIYQNDISRKRMFCSLECFRPRVDKSDKNCKFCNKKFSFKRHKTPFCSNKCYGQNRQINTIKRKVESGKFDQPATAKKYLMTIHTSCEDCGWNLEPKIFEIHHIDRNKKNNNLNNLKILCPNCHTLDHYLSRNGQFSNNLGRLKNAS